MVLKLTLPAFAPADEADLSVPAAIALINTRNVEPIGYWYHLAGALSADLAGGVYMGAKMNVVVEETTDDKAFLSRVPEPKKFVKLTDEEFETDWYDILKLESGDLATENDIRAAYRKRCLETHPDKQPDHSDVMFKKVQRAFEILGSSAGRRAIDSSRPFDDTIPDENPNMDAETYFKTFGPVFERNRKWSIDPKIPGLGDDETPVKEVNRIYDCWYRFNSWRDFSHISELEKISEDMSREEKRFYQRENQRILDKHKRVETKRIRTLVERAQKMDPRLRRFREAEIAAREKERLDKIAEKERVRNEEFLRKAAIAAKEKAEKQAAADAIAAARNNIKVCEAAMLEFFKSNNLIEDVNTNLFQKYAVRPPNVAWLYSKIHTSEEASAFLEEIKAESVTPSEDKSVPAVLAFNDLVVMKEQLLGMSRYGEPMKRVSAEDMAERRRIAAEAKAAKKAAEGTA